VNRRRLATPTDYDAKRYARLNELRERFEMGVARSAEMTAHATLTWCATAPTSAALAAVMGSPLPPRAPSDVWPSPPSLRTGSIAPPLGADEEKYSRAYEQLGDIEKAAAAIGKSRTWGYETHRRLFGPKR